MRFAFSEDQQWLKTSARRFCQENVCLDAFGVGQASANPPQLWKQISQELAWTALIIPEEFGGAGLGFIELAALVEEMGRFLIPSPFFGTICLGANSILLAGSQAQKEQFLPAIASGELTATLAYAELGRSHDLAAIKMVAKRNGPHYELTGTKSFVVDGDSADLIIVAAREEETNKLELFSVDGNHDQIIRTSLATMDQTRCLGQLVFDHVQVPLSARLSGAEQRGKLVSNIIDRAAIALAAEQVGAAEYCLDLAVNYAKDRHQFGQPIGSFQAIKHKCADMLLQVESARSAAYFAAWAADHAPDETESAAALAKVYCSEAYFACAAESIQIHGGIGFTWEHQAHRYFKRAQADELFLGSPDYYRDRMAKEIGL